MLRIRVAFFAVLTLAGALAAPPAARAAASPWAEQGPVSARLVSAVEAVGELESIPLALHVRLEPHWKVYWRSPGDAGLPPRLDWSGSDNLADAPMAYPAPKRFTLLGFENFGYEGEVAYPIALTPARPGEPLDLKLKLNLLACSDICVPHDFEIDFALPAGPAFPSAEANLIDRYEARIPDDGRASGISLTRVAAAGDELIVEAAGREPFAAPDVIVESDPQLSFGAPEIALFDGGRRLRATFVPAYDDVPLAGLPVVATIVDGPRAAELPGTAIDAAPPLAALLSMLGVAFLGGLILNVMPCVLPVLSLKLLGVARLGGAERGVARAGLLATAGGVLFSFLILASALAALKGAGAAVGWGLQFQQPLFLIFMVLTLALFAANLLGFFEIPLPRRLADAVGGREHGGFAGHFATGAFATLLATPCSAPFVGTAVAFALSRGPAEIYAVFAALGVGLASPYLVVAAWPRLAGLSPKPGRWMVWLRRVLAVALSATALWLLAVLAAQIGEAGALAVGGLLLGLVVLLGLRRRLAGRAALVGGAGALLAAAAFAVPSLTEAPAPAVVSDAETAWRSFDEAAIRDEVAAGRVVFVDVTADWCVTCQANKALVLERGAAAEALAQRDVVPMQADWTRPDPDISFYLASFGRYGIPFNVVYGPGAPSGEPLPELLSTQDVLDALDRAAGTTPWPKT